jgi:hypothetical protein
MKPDFPRTYVDDSIEMWDGKEVRLYHDKQKDTLHLHFVCNGLILDVQKECRATVFSDLRKICDIVKGKVKGEQDETEA